MTRPKQLCGSIAYALVAAGDLKQAMALLEIQTVTVTVAAAAAKEK